MKRTHTRTVRNEIAKASSLEGLLGFVDQPKETRAKIPNKVTMQSLVKDLEPGAPHVAFVPHKLA